MADNTEQLHKVKPGDHAFMLCSCDNETPFDVLAIVGEQPIIAALVCPTCEQVLPVANGIVGEKP